MNKLTTWLFNPFHYIAGGTALWLGSIFLLIAAGLAPILSIDGDKNFYDELLKLLIIIGSNTVALWIAAKLLTKTKFRILDLVGTQMLAFWPFILIQIFIQAVPFTREMVIEIMETPSSVLLEESSFIEGAMRLIMNFVVLLFLIWTIVLMYRSFKISCNVKGEQNFISFGIAIFLAVSFAQFVIYILI